MVLSILIFDLRNVELGFMEYINHNNNLKIGQLYGMVFGVLL